MIVDMRKHDFEVDDNGSCIKCGAIDSRTPQHHQPPDNFGVIAIPLDGGSSPVDELLRNHLPGMVALFRMKARDYSSGGTNLFADALGARGQFAELWRKIAKLKRSMWDGEELQFEQTDEILSDLFGHIMLAIDYVRR